MSTISDTVAQASLQTCRGESGAARVAPADLNTVLTIVIVTSPVISNPSTEMLDRLVASLLRHLPGAAECKLVVACDGYSVGAHDPGRRNFGVVSAEQASDYEAFKARLRGRRWRGAVVEEAAAWRGFALSLQSAIEMHVHTPLVMVCPHDYEFLHSVDMPRVCGVLLGRPCQGRPLADPGHTSAGQDQGTPVSPRVNYIGFCAGKQVKRSLPKAKQGYPDDTGTVMIDGLQLSPVLAWKENPHVATVDAYRELVFDAVPGSGFRVGEFIEDRLGNWMRRMIKEKGMQYHREKYCMYLLSPAVANPADSAEGSQCPTLYHMDGRCYRPVAERLRLGWKVAAWEVERVDLSDAVLQLRLECGPA